MTEPMTGTLINDIIETVDNRLEEARTYRDLAEHYREESESFLDLARAIEAEVDSLRAEFPLDDNTAEPAWQPCTVVNGTPTGKCEPLDEMERRTR